MSGPVNVLAVLTHHANGLRLGPKLTRAQFERVADDLERVHAAVAELIGFVQDCADGRPEAEPSECRKRAIALLARVGGAK